MDYNCYDYKDGALIKMPLSTFDSASITELIW